MGFREKVTEITDGMRDFLIEKNESYGNSALRPTRIFSNSDSTEQILVRIDDKLSRIKGAGGFKEMARKARESGNDNYSEDVIKDLIGYLIILDINLSDDG